MALLKRGAAVLMILLFLLGTARAFCESACPASPGGAPPPPRILLIGSVMRGRYARPGGTSRGPTYQVELTLRNEGAGSLTFDVAEAAWLTAAGKGLHARTTRQGRVWRLEGGDSAEYEFDTNGYTGNLLHDASGGPLFFQITLFAQGKVVAVPYRALLPPLARVPDAAAIRAAEKEGGRVSVQYLRFVAGRPAPVRGPNAPQAGVPSVSRSPNRARRSRTVASWGGISGTSSSSWSG